VETKTGVCFLQIDRNVVCDEYPHSTQHFAPQPVYDAAIAVVVMYAITVPALYAWLLYAASDSLTLRRPPTSLSNAISFLASGYREEVYFWELVEVAEKLILTGFLAPFQTGTFLQLFIAAIVSICFAAVEIFKQPYATPSLNFLALVYSVAVVLTIQGALGFKIFEQDPAADGRVLLDVASSRSSEATLAVLIGSAVAVLAAGAVTLSTQLVRGLRRQTMRLVATGDEPLLVLGEGHNFHGFISHAWARTHST
jgi:hypothetical protein